MYRRLLAAVSAAIFSTLASSSALAALLGTFTFGTLPGSPAAGDLAWITDGGGAATVGAPAAGGGSQRDLISWDATQTRWEFVTRIPASAPPAAIEKFLAAVRIDYDPAGSGASATDVQAALDELFATGPGGGATDLGATPAAGNVLITSSTGDDATLPAATGSAAGVLTAADKTKLDGITAGATPGLGNHTATQNLDLATFGTLGTMGTPGIQLGFPLFSITNPATTTMGSGVGWGADQVAKNYPGGTEIDTRNHVFGWFYNKTGINGAIGTNCEPAWDWSHETNFRTTSLTADDSWPELNFDLYPSAFTTVPTGVTGTFAAGDYLTFSGGGTGKVVSFSGGTLTYRHTTSPCAANGQTITNVSQAGGGTVASLTYIGTNQSDWLRAMQFEWDTADSEVRWIFDTLPVGDARPSALRIKNSAVGIFMPDDLTRRFSVWNDGSFNTFANAIMEFDEAGRSGQNLNADILEFRHDYGANVNTHSFARSIHILTPLGGSGPPNITRAASIHIENQNGFGSTDSSIMKFDSQLCGGAACADGLKNAITHSGFGWNTGHFVASAEAGSGDHLWRDGTTERWRTSTNGAPVSATGGRALAELVTNAQRALATAAIASGACSTADTGITATGVAATDVISWSFNGDVSGVTGYAPVTTGALMIYAYTGANQVNFKVCNPTASSITPGAVTLNWTVVR